MSDSANSPSAAPFTEAQDRQWATISHFAGILGFLPPLIIWLVFRGRTGATKTSVEAKESTNFQITVNAVIIVLWILSAILGSTVLGVILPILVLLVYLASLVLVFLAGIKVNGGGAYRYPVNLRLIK